MSSLVSRINAMNAGKPNEKPANRGVHPRPYAVKTRTPPAQAQFDEILIWVLIGLLALGPGEPAGGGAAWNCRRGRGR